MLEKSILDIKRATSLIVSFKRNNWLVANLYAEVSH